ncbi:hypothetical protein EAI_09579 [Harpegnathos saltator]|uniref:Uncharacterized protein n=1 Tax=Harpegnathos saltator TaxID=610380 RepID=E2BQ61_HARSA|nr:hypothetical protein EAI_09579 [Harpegnathos saltator]
MGECHCSNITIMQLFHELKQQFPALPDHVVSQCIAQVYRWPCWPSECGPIPTFGSPECAGVSLANSTPVHTLVAAT